MLLGKGKLQLVLLFFQEHLLEVTLGPGAPPGGAPGPSSTTDRCSSAGGTSSWSSLTSEKLEKLKKKSKQLSEIEFPKVTFGKIEIFYLRESLTPISGDSN